MGPFVWTFMLVYGFLKLVAMLLGFLVQAIVYLFRGLYLALYFCYKIVKEMMA
jgi:hypothetical protein